MLSDNLTATMDLVGLMIDKGNAFRAFTEFTVPANGEYAISVETGEEVAVLYNRIVTPDQPNIRYEVRLGATTQNLGVQIPVFPANAKRIKQSGVVMRPCTYTDAGTLSDIDIIPGQAASGSNKGGQVYSPDETKPIPENLETLVIIKNPNNNECNVLVYYKWFEVGANSWDQ
jgi:hypothetical protein